MAVTKSLNKYRYKCQDLDSYVFEWAEVTPSGCIHSPLHTIVSGTMTIVEKLEQNTVKADILTENNPTGGHYRGEFLKITTTGIGEWFYTDFVKPFPVSLATASFNLQESQVGDELWVDIMPDTIIGVLTSPVTSGDTILNVSQTVIDNIQVGFDLRLTTDTINYFELGPVIAKDTVNNQITLNTGSPSDFSSGTYCVPEITLHGPSELGNPGLYEMGDFIVKGKRFEANSIIRFKYKNNTGPENKSFYIEIEYFY